MSAGPEQSVCPGREGGSADVHWIQRHVTTTADMLTSQLAVPVTACLLLMYCSVRCVWRIWWDWFSPQQAPAGATRLNSGAGWKGRGEIAAAGQQSRGR
jgi:hypothetical protein